MSSCYPNYIIVMVVRYENPSKKDQPKRPSQNVRIQINLSKMALWSSWTWGQKIPKGRFF